MSLFGTGFAYAPVTSVLMRAADHELGKNVEGALFSTHTFLAVSNTRTRAW